MQICAFTFASIARRLLLSQLCSPLLIDATLREIAVTFISIYRLSQQMTQRNRARDGDRAGRGRQRDYLTNGNISAATSVSLPTPHKERAKRGVSSHDSQVQACVCVWWWDNRGGRETQDQRKVRLVAVFIFICLTKFTDRGAEVEARRRSASTGHSECSVWIRTIF